MDEDRLDVIAAREALTDPERISFEDARKELGLNEAPRTCPLCGTPITSRYCTGCQTFLLSGA